MKWNISRIKGNRRGLTLLELMISVSVIGVWAGIALVGYFSYRERAYWLEHQFIIRHLMDAQHYYFMDTGKFYPQVGRIHVETGSAENIPELNFSFEEGHKHTYRFRTVHNERNKRYVIDIWSDFDFDNNGRKDRFRLTTWYRDGQIHRHYYRKMKYLN